MHRHLIANPWRILGTVALVTGLWASSPSNALPVALAPAQNADDTADAR